MSSRYDNYRVVSTRRFYKGSYKVFYMPEVRENIESNLWSNMLPVKNMPSEFGFLVGTRAWIAIDRIIMDSVDLNYQ